MSDRRVHLRPYVFEIVAAANLLLIGVLALRHGIGVFRSLNVTLYSFGAPLLLQLIGGVIVRGVVTAWRGNFRVYLRHINTPGWWSDSFRVLLFGTVLIDTYGWIKLTIPVLHPRLLDRAFWDLDRTLLFGLQPNILFLNLFSPSLVLHAFDWSYANIFLASLFLAFGYFLSAPSRRLRVGFLTSMGILWMVGAWLYMLLPTLGPAYYFPDVWFAYRDELAKTQGIQALLMRNYQTFLRVRAGGDGSVNILYGIAAFPSLHVGFQTLVFFWFRRLWLYGEMIFGIFILLVFLG
ncbi:MAG: phosphatase PAP2 family protein, partial [Thermoanaerobaculia bacterium]